MENKKAYCRWIRNYEESLKRKSRETDLKKNNTAPDEHIVCGRQNREALGHPKIEGVNHRTEQSPTQATPQSQWLTRRGINFPRPALTCSLWTQHTTTAASK